MTTSDVNDITVTTPLHNAVKNGHLNAVKLLLKHNANVNIKDHTDNKCDRGTTPLILAAMHNQIDIANELLDNQANANVKSLLWDTPLHLAVSYNYKDMVRLLLKYEADIESRGVFDHTSMHIASEEGHYDMVKLLLNNGADIEPESERYRTPLACAVLNKQTDVVRLILNHPRGDECSIDVATLFKSLTDDNIDVIELLLKSGIDEEVFKDVNNKRTLLHHAVLNEQYDIVKLLLNYKHSIYTSDIYGLTPLLYSKSCKNTKIKDLLMNYHDTHYVIN